MPAAGAPRLAGAVTSGELTHRFLSDRPDAFWAGLGDTCVHVSWSSRGKIALDDLQLRVTADPAQAGFLLVHGTEAVAQPDGSLQERSVRELEQFVAACAAARTADGGQPLPMIVANPDLVTVDGADLVVMPGTLAKAYAAAGGNVVLMGKPAPLIYDAARRMLGGLEPHELLAVGDSLEHDVAGAQAAGVDALFVAGGIHADELLPPPPPPAGAAAASRQDGGSAAAATAAVDGGALARLCAHHKVSPQYVIPVLR